MTDRSPHTPLAPARRAHILDALTRGGVVRNSELIEQLGVTPVTLRRDLARMEEEGLLHRVHGGAVHVTGAMAEAAGFHDEAPIGSRGSIAVLVPSLSFYWPTVVRGIEAEAHRQGFRVLLRGGSYELQDERPVLERLVESEQVRGLIVAPNTDTPHAQEVIQWLSESRVPSVLAERDGYVLPGDVPAESVTTDHALGGMLAARHLAALGHRKVGLVMSRTSPTSRKIAAGWDAACRRARYDGGRPFRADSAGSQQARVLCDGQCHPRHGAGERDDGSAGALRSRGHGIRRPAPSTGASRCPTTCRSSRTTMRSPSCSALR